MIPTAIGDEMAICGVGRTKIDSYPNRNALSLWSDTRMGMPGGIEFDCDNEEVIHVQFG